MLKKKPAIAEKCKFHLWVWFEEMASNKTSQPSTQDASCLIQTNDEQATNKINNKWKYCALKVFAEGIALVW